MKLSEMAQYAKHKPRFLYSGQFKFMMKATEIFHKYDPDVEVDGTGLDIVEVIMELDPDQAEVLGNELEEFDEWWFDEFGYNPYGGYIQL